MAQTANNAKIRLVIRWALALTCAFSIFGLPSCTPTEEEPVEAPPYYNQAGFSRNGQFYVYEEEGRLAQKTGVDVSDHQGWIDWDTVSKSGIKFTYIRAGYRGSTEGGLFQDDYFEYNMQAAKEAGLELGVYFFSQAITEEEAREEADFVLQLLSGQKLDYPIAFDFEMSAQGIQSRVANLSSEETSRIARVFCNAIEAGGYNCCLYGNRHDLGRYDSLLLDNYPIWYAEYSALPSYTEEYFLWQYASVGVVSGIDGEVDLNLDLSSALEED